MYSSSRHFTPIFTFSHAMVIKLVNVSLLNLSSAENITVASRLTHYLYFQYCLQGSFQDGQVVVLKYAFIDYFLVKILNVGSFLSNILQILQDVIIGLNFTKPPCKHHNTKLWVHLYRKLCQTIKCTSPKISPFSIEPANILLQLEHSLHNFNYI